MSRGRLLGVRTKRTPQGLNHVSLGSLRKILPELFSSPYFFRTFAHDDLSNYIRTEDWV